MAHGGSGSLFFDPLTQTVSAVMAAGQSRGKSPFKDFGQVGPRTESANTQDAENISKEHSKTELQRLSHMGQEIKVHEIIDDENKLSSMETTEKLLLEADDASAAANSGEQGAKAGIDGKLAGRSRRQPPVMRFSPSLSSREVDISVSGFTARATHGTATARANMVFHEGVHYWEVTCPIRCTSIQIGVSSKGKDTVN